jgi:hypothetical protein
MQSIFRGLVGTIALHYKSISALDLMAHWVHLISADSLAQRAHNANLHDARQSHQFRRCLLKLRFAPVLPRSGEYAAPTAKSALFCQV